MSAAPLHDPKSTQRFLGWLWELVEINLFGPPSTNDYEQPDWKARNAALKP